MTGGTPSTRRRADGSGRDTSRGGAGTLAPPPEGSSSVGRASVSKTDGRGFESLLPCPDDREEHVAAMSLDDLNREQKRMLKRQGAIDEKGAPTRAVRQTKRERVGPAQYLREVRDEMRKVAWPTRPEVVRYSIIVTLCVLVYMVYVGFIDYGMAYFADWFYG